MHWILDQRFVSIVHVSSMAASRVNTRTISWNNLNCTKHDDAWSMNPSFCGRCMTAVRTRCMELYNHSYFQPWQAASIHPSTLPFMMLSNEDTLKIEAGIMSIGMAAAYMYVMTTYYVPCLVWSCHKAWHETGCNLSSVCNAYLK